MTNGNAVPSLSPASAVMLKRSLSWSDAFSSCTSEANTGSVGASTAPQQNGGSGTQSQEIITHHCDQSHRERHGKEGQPYREPPALVSKRQAEFQARSEKGYDYAQFGNALKDRGLMKRVKPPQRESQRLQGNSGSEVKQGRGQRQTL